MINLTTEEKRSYVLRIGASGIKSLAVIDQLKSYIDRALEDRGLEEDIKDHAFIFNKIYEALIKGETVTPLDLAKLQLSLGRIKITYDYIVSYESAVKEVKGKETESKISKRTRRSPAKQDSR
jgi:hypothetical protein